MDMDSASIITTFPVELRGEVLLTFSKSFLTALSPALLTEAQMLRERAMNEYQARSLFGFSLHLWSQQFCMFALEAILGWPSCLQLPSGFLMIMETRTGQVAGILTTHRVMITSANVEILACCPTSFDKGFPPFRSLLWVGPALLFSTATIVGVLGWDGLAWTVITINTPYAALVGTLNNRLLLACSTDVNPRQKQSVEIKTRLVGLFEPLLIGWATMQQKFESKLDLSEILYQLTSRFDKSMTYSKVS